MVLINGKKFKLYVLDDMQTFKQRLADIMGTTTSYLYFPKDVTIKYMKSTEDNIIVEDILAEIKKSKSVLKLIKQIQSKVGKIKYDKGRLIIRIWLSYQKDLGKLQRNLIGDALEKENIYISSMQIEHDWKDSKKTRETIKRQIMDTKTKVVNTLILFKRYKDIKKLDNISKFHIERLQIDVALNIRGISLLEIFNTIKLTSEVPFATTNRFYKVLSEFVPLDEWAVTSDDSILLQVSQKKNIVSVNISNYEQTIIRVNPITKQMVSEITMNTKDNISREEYISRSLSVFNKLNIKIEQEKEKNVVGVFYYPNKKMNKYVFSDLAMNNEIFSRLLSIDDHDKATKMKAGVYIHFYHPLTGNITATLTGKIMIKDDPTMKNVDQKAFEPGESFIRVKVSKADSIQSVKLFQEILGKLLVLYEKEKDSVVSFYKNYLPTFGDEQQQVEKKREESKLTTEAPEIFVANYSRNCKSDRLPTLISEEEASIAYGKGLSVMKFPRDVPEEKNAFKFPMDGVDQNYYICNNPEYKYVGIRNNKLKNDDAYPYVPCCYKSNQEKKPKYLHYYQGKELKFGGKKQNNIIKTNKILKHDQFGTLPQNIENLFTIIDPDPAYEYVRKGVYHSKNSFINAVMEAFNDETHIMSIQEEVAVRKVIKRERKKLAKNRTVSLCRQELYDKNTEEIISLIQDDSVYFDPKIFIHLLEDRFNCNIFLFTRQTLNGKMVLPRHLQAYYKNRNKIRCIYIYEHMGSESDHAKHPQCELIVRYNITEKYNTQLSFSYKEAKNVRAVYSKIRQSFALNIPIKESYMPIGTSIKIDSQWIDSYGKTRQLNIVFNNQLISIITSPIQPIKVKETTVRIIHLVETEILMDLIKSLNMRIDYQVISDNTLKEINGVIGNVKVSIPVKPTAKLPGILEKHHGLNYPDQQVSSLEQYNFNKKIARYLVEYTRWVYSTYLYENKVDEIDNKNLEYFSKNYFNIKPTHKYKYIEKTFNTDNSILKNGKLIVHNMETIKRLLYVLKLSIYHDLEYLRDYRNSKVIYNYYVDITDFDTYKNQILLYGEESIEKWITENNIMYTIHNEVQIGKTSPYFFKNSLIENGKVYLAQNTQTLEKASDIALSWIKKRYNVGDHAENRTPIAFTLYSYRNGNDIQPGRKISGQKVVQKVDILGYKIDDVPEYTVLLDLMIVK